MRIHKLSHLVADDSGQCEATSNTGGSDSKNLEYFNNYSFSSSIISGQCYTTSNTSRSNDKISISVADYSGQCYTTSNADGLE